MLYAAEGQHAQIIIVMCLRKTPHYVTSQSCKESVLHVQHNFFSFCLLTYCALTLSLLSPSSLLTFPITLP